MRVLRHHARWQEPPRPMRLDLVEMLESRRLLSAAGGSVSPHGEPAPAGEVQDHAPSTRTAASTSSSDGPESESHNPAAQVASSSSASGEGDGAAASSHATQAASALATTSTPKANTPSTTPAASASSSDQSTAASSASNSSASNDGETESETSSSASASSSSANSSPASPVTKPRSAAAATTSDSGGSSSSSAATQVTDPNLMAPHDGQSVAPQAAAASTPQTDAAKTLLKPATPATGEAEATSHTLSHAAAASLALAGNALLSMQAVLPASQGGETPSMPPLNGAIVAVQLVESNASRQLAGAVAQLAEGAVPSAQGAMLAVARLREMLAMQQLGNVAEVPQLFSLNTLSSFADAVAQFAHESALGTTITQATSHHELAWAVTFATLAADAILIGRWRAGRSRKGVVHPDAGTRFSRKRIA